MTIVREAGEARPRVAMLAPFQVRSFRFQWPADMVTSWATEMEVIVLGWYILVETDSVLLLTALASLQFIGTLVAPFLGLVGDRVGHRNLICIMRVFYLALAAVMAMVLFAGWLNPVIVFAVSAMAGMVRPSDMGLRNVLVVETMPADRLMSAISLARITGDTARIAGALAGAGTVAALGMGPAYLAIMALYAIAALLSLGIASRRPGSARARLGTTSPFRDLREAATVVLATPQQLATILLAFLVNLTAYPFVLGLTPYIAREVYRTDQTGLGYLVAGTACGAVAASLLLSRMGPAARPARLMLTFSLVWHGLVLVLAHVESFAIGMPVLVLMGVAQGLCIVPMSMVLLRNAPPELRGRIMGLRMLAVYGLPMGLLIAGQLIEHLGFAATAMIYGVTGIGCTLLILFCWHAHLWPRGAPANAA